MKQQKKNFRRVHQKKKNPRGNIRRKRIYGEYINKKSIFRKYITEQTINESEFCENKSIHQDLSECEGVNPNTLQENQASAEQAVTTNRTVKRKVKKQMRYLNENMR